MNKIFLFSALLFSYRCVSQESYIEKSHKIICNYIATNNLGDKTFLLLEDTYDSLSAMYSDNSIFKQLKQILPDSIISGLKNNQYKNMSFKWDSTIPCVKTVSKSSELYARATENRVIIRRKHLFGRKTYTITESPKSNYYLIQTSKPIFYNQYCLIQIYDRKSGCVYLYECTKEQNWHMKETFGCYNN